MNGLDVNIRNTRDVVQDTDNIHVSFTALFNHTHSQHIIYNTNFIERLTPQIRDMINQFYDEYCMHVALNVHTQAAEVSSTTVRHQQHHQPHSQPPISLLLGSSRRVIHEHHYQDQTCTICHASYKQNEFVRLLPTCRHLFHKRCIDPWIKRNHMPTCPICRAIIVPPQTNSNPPETVHLSDVQAGPTPTDTNSPPGDSTYIQSVIQEGEPPSLTAQTRSLPDASASPI